MSSRILSQPSAPLQEEVTESPNATFFKELFSPAFMFQYTDFQSMDELILKSGFRIESVEDISRVDDKTWNGFIAERTRFGSWEAMQQMAFAEWSQRKLGI